MKFNPYVLILFLSVFISALSQILLKISANRHHKSWIFEYLNILVITAYFLFFGAVVIDLFGLKYVPASFIPVIETSSYIFILILSRIVFKEKLNRKQIVAMCCIITGILIYVV